MNSVFSVTKLTSQDEKATNGDLMKKRTTITTEKREIWIITEGDLQSPIPGPASSTDRAEGDTDTALVTTEQLPTTTNEIEDSEKE